MFNCRIFRSTVAYDEDASHMSALDLYTGHAAQISRTAYPADFALASPKLIGSKDSARTSAFRAIEPHYMSKRVIKLHQMARVVCIFDTPALCWCNKSFRFHCTLSMASPKLIWIKRFGDCQSFNFEVEYFGQVTEIGRASHPARFGFGLPKLIWVKRFGNRENFKFEVKYFGQVTKIGRASYPTHFAFGLPKLIWVKRFG
jgi:hypothetical protein